MILENYRGAGLTTQNVQKLRWNWDQWLTNETELFLILNSFIICFRNNSIIRRYWPFYVSGVDKCLNWKLWGKSNLIDHPIRGVTHWNMFGCVYSCQQCEACSDDHKQLQQTFRCGPETNYLFVDMYWNTTITLHYITSFHTPITPTEPFHGNGRDNQTRLPDFQKVHQCI